MCVVLWEQSANNDFLMASQFRVTDALYPCSPDLVDFVNDLSWVVIEMKEPGVAARQASDERLANYKHPGIPAN